jgi:hypothetical protein
MRIVFPDYPVKVKMSNSRRAKYFEEGQDVPRKYQTDEYTYKKGRLFDLIDKSFVIKNARFVDEPRYQSLSYNKISTQLKVPVLIKLKEWMTTFMPTTLGMTGPLRVTATVYDWPVPLNKDLDNMHIYYKAFLDLLKQRGMIVDDSKQHITMAGGFRFIPILHESDRKLVFDIEPETSELLVNHLMFNMTPKQVTRTSAVVHDDKYELFNTDSEEPGHIVPLRDSIAMNFGKTKIIKANAERMFRQTFDWCVNHNRGCLVSENFYRIHADRIQKLLLDKGIPVSIKIDNHGVNQG